VSPKSTLQGLWMAAACAVGAVPAGGAAAAGLCSVDEITYLSCTTARMRQLSLCGKAPQALQYRYGRSAQAIELRFPDNAADGAAQMLYAHYSRYQTERLEVRFDNHGTGYTLFEYLEGRRRSAGVRVVTAEGREQMVACASRIVSRLGELEGRLPCDVDNALNLGGCR
jgi:hypothetical protein